MRFAQKRRPRRRAGAELADFPVGVIFFTSGVRVRDLLGGGELLEATPRSTDKSCRNMPLVGKSVVLRSTLSIRRKRSDAIAEQRTFGRRTGGHRNDL